jgi:AraC-like DNA-binding protein
MNPALTELKTKEALELLLRLEPGLKYFLFDFSEPYKIDLEAYMHKNYMFNVPTARFAQLTGRSLASFKRDFQKIFSTSPGQWLQQKRLAEAYYQIRQQGRKPSDVYLDVGFENLSHFSYSFKKAYGVAPSMI